MENTLSRTAPIVMRRGAEVKTPEVESESEGWESALGKPPRRCFCCHRLTLQGRTISDHLFICDSCDDDGGHKHTHEDTMRRTGDITPPAPEEALCCACGKTLINKHRQQLRMKRLTSGDISDADRERIKAQLLKKDWKYLGKGQYIHNRCSKAHVKKEVK